MNEKILNAYKAYTEAAGHAGKAAVGGAIDAGFKINEIATQLLVALPVLKLPGLKKKNDIER